MNKFLTTLLAAAAVLSTAGIAFAGPDAMPERDREAVDQLRQRPDETRSRYPDTGIDKGPSELSNTQPPENGHSMDMNDSTNDINDSTLEVPNPNRPNR